jgi:prepilin-type N-terminal cleavage/methylation domain-containing protein
MSMRRTGFTLLELLIGMVITALVMTALATVTYAVSVNWRTAELVESSYMAGAQVNARFSQWFRSAANLGATQSGSLTPSGSTAAIFFWKGDTTSNSYPNGDGKIQFNEIALLEHDQASQEVRLYSVSDWSSWSIAAQTAADALAGSAYIGSTATMDDFKTACAAYKVLVKNCTGLVLKKSTTDTPLVEYVINIRRPNGSIGTYYGTIVLRAASNPSN